MMRPRTTGTSAAARPQLPPAQTFNPKSEWKHEEEASFLFVYLPGFSVEQLTITPDYSNRRVKVEGKRWLANNRSLIVNETFNIPEDCDLSKTDKQFGRGILMLKMQRIITAQHEPQQAETTEETKEETSKSMTQKDEDLIAFRKQSPDKAATILSVTTTMDEKSTAITAANKSDAEQKLVEKKEENDANGKPAKPGSPEILVQNAGVKEEESKEQSKESAMGVAEVEEKEKEKEKNSKLGYAKGKEAGRENANVSAEKEMVKEVNEERKLLMNMGAAFLIIMGLGVSLLYILGRKQAR